MYHIEIDTIGEKWALAGLAITQFRRFSHKLLVHTNVCYL